MYMCVWGINFAYVCMILRLDIGNSVVFFVFHYIILLICTWFVDFKERKLQILTSKNMYNTWLA